MWSQDIVCECDNLWYPNYHWTIQPLLHVLYNIIHECTWILHFLTHVIIVLRASTALLRGVWSLCDKSAMITYNAPTSAIAETLVMETSMNSMDTKILTSNSEYLESPWSMTPHQQRSMAAVKHIYNIVE